VRVGFNDQRAFEQRFGSGVLALLEIQFAEALENGSYLDVALSLLRFANF